MSKSLLDSAAFNVSCPNCGKTFKKTVGGVKAHPHFSCPSCGTGFNADQFAGGIKQADKSIADFQRNLANLSKNLKFTIKL